MTMRERWDRGTGLLARSTSVGLAVVLTVSASGMAASEDASGTQRAAIEPVPTRVSERIAQALGNNTEAIYRFVADHVRYEPYSGVLRGAAGTFYSRAGNSPDQALLLARLLNAASVDTRFVVGAMDEDAADMLLASGVADADAIRGHLATTLYQRLPGSESPALPTRAEYAPAYEEEQAQDVDAWAAGQLTGTLRVLDAALGDAGVSVGGSFTEMPADELAEHTWVQASIDGEWVDLDPSLPGKSIGDILVEAGATLDAIPDDRWHRVELGIIAERIEDGVLVTEELMTLDGTAEEFAGRPIIITNVGSESVPALASAFESVLGLESVHPAIVVGTHNSAGAGMLFKQPDEAGGGLGGGFFDTGDRGYETTAQWVELRIMSPGRELITARRTVFDRLGADAREAGNVDVADLPPIAAYDLDGDGVFDLAPEHWISWLNVNTGVPSMHAEVVGQDDDAPARVGIVPFSHHVLVQMGIAQDAVALGVRPFIDAPNVTALTVAVVEGSDGSPTLESVVDIWHRSSGVAEVADIEPSVNPAMLPGVLTHLSERLMTGAADVVRSPRGVSVGAIFEAAVDQGVPLRVVSESGQVAGVASSAESRRRLLGALDDGWIVVAPERPVTLGTDQRTGWWLVDPASGRVVDEMDDGRGAELLGKIIVGGLGLLLAGLLIDHVIALIYSEIEGPLWNDANNKIDTQVTF